MRSLYDNNIACASASMCLTRLLPQASVLRARLPSVQQEPPATEVKGRQPAAPIAPMLPILWTSGAGRPRQGRSCWCWMTAVSSRQRRRLFASGCPAGSVATRVAERNRSPGSDDHRVPTLRRIALKASPICWAVPGIDSTPSAARRAGGGVDGPGHALLPVLGGGRRRARTPSRRAARSTSPLIASISVGRPASRSCSIDGLCVRW